MTDIGDTSHPIDTTTIPQTPFVSQPINRPNPDNIPAELKSLNQWTLWRYELNGDGKQTKVPYQINGYRAKSNDRNTWYSFDEVWNEYERGKYAGIMLALTKDDPYAVIDFDHMIAADGTIDSRVNKLVTRFKSYTEASPSGTGIHVVIKANLSQNRKTKFAEIYDSKRFITFTGKQVSDYYYFLQDVPSAYSELFGPSSSSLPESNILTGIADTSVLTEDDEKLRETMFNSKPGKEIKKLWDGNWSDYDSQSEADLKLCGDLAWWCNFDIQRTDRFFRNSGLIREKWDEVRRSDGATYGQMTLEAVYEGKKLGDGYTSIIPKTSSQKLRTSTAHVIMQTQYEAVPHVVDGILPVGLAILASRPKIGKSWLALDMALCIASGKEILDRETIQGDVLYLGLEDTESRIQRRMRMLLEDREAPATLAISCECENLDRGGQEAIFEWVDSHPNARLIVIDTWAKIAPSKKPGVDDYSFTSEKLKGLHRKALDSNLTILLVHHNRKPSKEGDVFDQVLGSTAFTGIADSTLVLNRERTQNLAVLSYTGRDIMEEEIGLEFDEYTGHWRRVGDGNRVRLPPAQAQIVEAIEAGYSSPKAISEYLHKTPSTVQNTLTTLLGKGTVNRSGNGTYSLVQVTEEISDW